MRLLWLPEVLRAAGLTVREVDGWRTRGSDHWGPIRGIICHATAGSRTSTDAGEISVLVNGSATAPGPIAQLYLSRSGTWYVVASGLCYHSLWGWAGPNKDNSNSTLLGIEAQHDNRDEPWAQAQYQSYVTGTAALVRKLGIPVARVAGHKEHQPWPPPAGQTSTKSDPTFDMTVFRARVSAALTTKEADMPLTDEDVKRVAHAVNDFRWPSTGLTLYSHARDAAGAATQARNDVAVVLAELRAMAGTDWVNEQQIIDGVLAGLGGKPATEAAAALLAVLGPERSAALAAALAAAVPDPGAA